MIPLASEDSPLLPGPSTMPTVIQMQDKTSDGCRTDEESASHPDENTRMLDTEKNGKNISSEKEEQDPVSASIGDYGKWQFVMTFLISLFNITCTSHIFIPTFSAAQRNYWCSTPSHLNDVDAHAWREFSQPSGPCSILDLDWSHITPEQVRTGVAPKANLTECTHWTFDGTGTTIISEWQLVCSNEEMNNLSEMMFLAGVALGGFVSGIISDKCGRKKTLMTLTILQTLIGVLISMLPWFTSYLVLRFILGSICVGIVFCGFVLCLELVGGKWRTVTGVSYLFPVSLAYCYVAGLAWLIRDWRHLQFAICIPGFLLLLLWFVIPESPRWLHAMKQKSELIMVIEKAIRFNNKEIPSNLEKILFSEREIPQHHDSQSSPGIIDLVKTKKMRVITLCMFIIWFATYLSYYGLVLNIGNIGGDLYVNSVLSGLVEIPALVATIFILMKLGRRWPICLSQVLGGLACILTLAVPTNPDLQWVATTLAMIAKFSISSANAMIPVFTAELYPTVIRNLGVGASNVPAGIALILIPYLWNLASFSKYVPMGVIGACSLIGGITNLRLPETGNKPLAETLEDEEDNVKQSIEERNSSKDQNNADGIYSIKYA